MVVTGQESLFAWIKKAEGGQGRILTAPQVFVKRLGLSTGVLLSQMLFWTDRAKNSENRFYHTQRQWMEELCLSAHEVKTGLLKLKNEGVIEAKVIRIKGEVTTLFRVLINEVTKWWNSHFQNGENHLSEKVKFTLSYITEKKEKMTDKDETCYANTKPRAKGRKVLSEEEFNDLSLGLIKETSMAFKQSVKGKVPTTAKEVASAFHAQKSKLLSAGGVSGNLSAQGLITLWVRGVPKYNESVSFMKEPTIAERGMFKHLANKCAQQSVPAGETLATAIKDWIGFVKFVQTRRGIYNVPTVPTIQFLLHYLEDAVDYWKQSTEIGNKKLVPCMSEQGTIEKDAPEEVVHGAMGNASVAINCNVEAPASYSDLLELKKKMFGKS